MCILIQELVLHQPGKEEHPKENLPRREAGQTLELDKGKKNSKYRYS